MSWFTNFQNEFPGFVVTTQFDKKTNNDIVKVFVLEHNLSIEERVHPDNIAFWTLDSYGIPIGVHHLALELKKKI